MTKQTHLDEFRQQMADAACLPQDDPRRIAVVRQVVDAGAWAEAEWLELTSGDERLRLDLWRVTPAPEIESRLLALPDNPPTATTKLWITTVTRRGLLNAAAVIAALFVLGGGTLMLTRSGDVTDRLNTLGLLAVDHHLINHPLAIVSPDIMGLQAQLARRVPFRVHLPRMDADDYTLMGGGICHVGGKEVACTRWARDGHTYTLLQFCPGDFELPEQFARRTVEVQRPWQAQPVVHQHASADRVEFWTMGDCAYAMVPDPTPQATTP